MISFVLLILASLGYLIASVLYSALLFKEHLAGRPTWLTIARAAGTGGVLLHTASIGIHCVTVHHPPLTTSPETLSATGWGIALVYLVVDLLLLRKKPQPAIGALAFPIAFLTVFLGANLSAHEPHAAGVQIDSKLISLHVMAILLSYGMMTLAVCCGALYLLEHRLLKQKRIAGGLFSRLPPLAAIDHLAFTLVSLAFPLLTLGLATGVIHAIAAGLPFVDPRTVLSALTWLVFGCYLALHSSRLAIGTRVNYLLFAGELVLLLTFFVHSPVHML